MTQITTMVSHGTRHPGRCLGQTSQTVSQVGLRKCESAALNMSANLENSPVATGLEKVSFHSSPKEKQSQRMSKLLHNCTHLTRWQSNAENFPR